jgi:glycosyltransferase involved in cell wall biosynthesis
MRLARRRVPLVYNLHTSLEEELPVYGAGGWRGQLAARFGRRVDRLLPAMSDACVAISPRAEEQLRAWGAMRVVRIGPGVDLEELAGGDAERARQRWQLGQRPWVVYTGNADAYQDLPVLYAAMSRVSHAGLLVVTGSDREPVWRAAREAGVPAERLRVVQSRDFADTLDALAVGAVGALPRAVCTGFPIKLLNMLGSGLVTVAAQGSAQPLEGVVSVPNNHPGAMAGAIQSVLADEHMTERLGDAARRSVAAVHGWAGASARLGSLYDTLIAEAATASS